MAQGDQLVADAITAGTTALVAAMHDLSTAIGNQTAQAALLADQVLQAAADLAIQTAAAAALVASVSAEVNKLRLVAMNTIVSESGKPRVLALDSKGVVWEYVDSNDMTKIMNHSAYNWRVAAKPAPLEGG